MRLQDLVGRGGTVVLTGAGISTESGIPDYRGDTGRARPATPMTYQVFTSSAQARQRYWARSHLGWRHLAAARPNRGHEAVAALQRAGLVSGLVTQNVDGLHLAAGSPDHVELHGNLARVVCLTCGDLSSREAVRERLTEANPRFERAGLPLRPDGDVDLEEVHDFVVVGCVVCGGVLKPDVVFFGETVPRDRVDRSFALVDQAESLLVLGSSLAVMSGYRFVLHAVRRGIPVAVVNQGATRADALATVKVEAPLGQLLAGLVADLDRASAPGQPLRHEMMPPSTLSAMPVTVRAASDAR